MSIKRVETFDFSRFNVPYRLWGGISLEISTGKVLTPWRRFVFPAVWGLVATNRTDDIGIRTLPEAWSYLYQGPHRHRLTGELYAVIAYHKKIELLFDSADVEAFWSCVTMFNRVANLDESCFQLALRRYFDGQEHERTLSLLGCDPMPLGTTYLYKHSLRQAKARGLVT
ncbi:DUF1810 family protein [Ramlibacter sp. AN1015]|uniref:DUF1810 family protein n=1 Tax=Ramlibacter sp. AN1015 TaxID=3133428 RepID=UPI0040409FB4